MDELREKIIALILDGGFPSDDVAEHMHRAVAETTADRILDIPEIREALQAQRRLDEVESAAEDRRFD